MIITLGHSGCAGIKNLVDTPKDSGAKGSFIRPWMGIVEDALERTKEMHKQNPEKCKYSMCEQEAIITSMKNLSTFPWIKERVEQQKLKLHGWYFSVVDGSLSVCSQEASSFEKVKV